MASVCSNSVVVPLPSRTSYFMHSTVEEQTSRPNNLHQTSSSLTNPESSPSGQSGCGHIKFSINELSITEVTPR
ncbi:hypothetical protein NC651_010118 [Populus alba x Populus x berolinensis]|nr:hypothetical protein NC651_010118 [Populus alba x Populus x berolinensis]